MNLLNVFAYVFEADTRAFKKGTQEADKQAKDLEKTVKQTDLAADRLGQSFRGLLLGAGQAIAAYLSVSGLMASSAAAARYADQVGLTSQALRVNAQELEAWSAAQRAAGGSAEGLQSSVKSLRGMLDDLRVWGVSEGAYALEYFGISLRDATGRMREPLEILPLLAAQFEKLSRPHQMDLAQRLGLDEGTVLLLQRGRQGVEDLLRRQKELGGVTEKDTRLSREYHMQLEDTRRAWQRLATDGNSTILPFMIRIAEKFEEAFLWLRENKDIATGFIMGVAGAITVAYLPAISAAAVATALWLAPWVAIGAAIGAVGAAMGLLWEDWKIFQEGGNSALGEMLRRWPILNDIVRDLLNDIRTIGAVTMALGALMADIFTGNWQGAFDRFAARLIEYFNRAGGVVGGIRDAWRSISASISEAIGKIMDFIRRAAEMGAKVKSFFGFGDKGAPGGPPAMLGGQAAPALEAAGRIMAPAAATPLATSPPARVGRGAGAVNRRNSVQIDRLEVNTQATDAAGISAAIGDTLGRELRTTIDQFDDGVDR